MPAFLVLRRSTTGLRRRRQFYEFPSGKAVSEPLDHIGSSVDRLRDRIGARSRQAAGPSCRSHDVSCLTLRGARFVQGKPRRMTEWDALFVAAVLALIFAVIIEVFVRLIHG